VNNPVQVQGDSRVIMSRTKFVMQPTIHILYRFLVFVFINHSTFAVASWIACFEMEEQKESGVKSGEPVSCEKYLGE
jgi:hypothetical protein